MFGLVVSVYRTTSKTRAAFSVGVHVSGWHIDLFHRSPIPGPPGAPSDVPLPAKNPRFGTCNADASMSERADLFETIFDGSGAGAPLRVRNASSVKGDQSDAPGARYACSPFRFSSSGGGGAGVSGASNDGAAGALSLVINSILDGWLSSEAFDDPFEHA